MVGNDQPLPRPTEPTQQPPLHCGLQIHSRLIKHYHPAGLVIEQGAQQEGFLHPCARECHWPLTAIVDHNRLYQHLCAFTRWHRMRSHVQGAPGQGRERSLDLLETLALPQIPGLQSVQFRCNTGAVTQVRWLPKLLAWELLSHRQPPVIREY
jgi:hypothetical protein